MQPDPALRERRTIWMRYATVMSVAAFVFVAVIFVLLLVAPDLVIPIAIVGAVLLSVLGGLAARRARQRDPLTRDR